MIRYANDQQIKRKAVLGRVLTFGGLGILVVGLIISIAYPSQANLVLGMALVGVFASQFGMVFYNRWGRRPRMDEILDEALKGLDGRFATFHYSLSTPHVLVSPAGVFALLPRVEDGEISYEKGTWTQTRPARRGTRTRPIRGLESSANTEVDAAQAALRKRLPGETLPAVRALLVFPHPRATLRVKDAPLLAAHTKKIKEMVRALPKGPTLSAEQVARLAEKLGLASGET